MPVPLARGLGVSAGPPVGEGLLGVGFHDFAKVLTEAQRIAFSVLVRKALHQSQTLSVNSDLMLVANTWCVAGHWTK
ncbi:MULTISPECIES: hypothetical protein [unclassified Streptomyces]|uniref:hypothetical protein n=1 Tax=unclassified Streptomyces TaxID=2593676 RepID=UPI0037ACE1E2